MATAAKLGYGSKLKRKIAGTYTAVLEVLSVSGPNSEASDVDVTNFDSADGFREFINGLKDGGEVTFETNYVKTEYARLLAVHVAGTLEDWQLLLTDGSNIQFYGTVKSAGIETPVEPQIKNSFSAKVSGNPVFTPA